MKTFVYSSALLLTLSLTFSSCDSGSTEGQKNDTSGAKTEKAQEAPATPALKLEDLVDLDLNANGVPAIIKAPKDAKVTKEESSVYVNGGNNFRIVVKYGKLYESAKETLAEEKKSKIDVYESKIATDEANGIIAVSKEGVKSFFYTADVKEGGYITIANDVFAIEVTNTANGGYTYSPQDLEVMYQAAKLTKVTK